MPGLEKSICGICDLDVVQYERALRALCVSGVARMLVLAEANDAVRGADGALQSYRIQQSESQCIIQQQYAYHDVCTCVSAKRQTCTNALAQGK